MFRGKHVFLVVVIVAIFLLFFYVVIPFEDGLLDSLVSTGPDIMLDDWRAAFRNWATLGISVALGAAVAWFVMGQWAFSLNRWQDADRRWSWWLPLLVVAGLAAVPGALLTPTTQEWGRLSVAFYVANNCLLYYVATLLCSPPSYKYTPPLAAAVRRFW